MSEIWLVEQRDMMYKILLGAPPGLTESPTGTLEKWLAPLLCSASPYCALLSKTFTRRLLPEDWRLPSQPRTRPGATVRAWERRRFSSRSRATRRTRTVLECTNCQRLPKSRPKITTTTPHTLLLWATTPTHISHRPRSTCASNRATRSRSKGKTGRFKGTARKRGALRNEPYTPRPLIHANRCFWLLPLLCENLIRLC